MMGDDEGTSAPTFAAAAAVQPITSVPSSEQDLHVDPRTGLEIIDVPEEYRKHFAELRGSLIHWFGSVDKVNRHVKPERRVCILSDRSLYMCMMNGGITRCISISTLLEIIVTPPAMIGIKIQPPDHDMLFSVSSLKEREHVAAILQKLFKGLTGQDIRVRGHRPESGEPLEDSLRLAKAKGWVLKIEPLRNKKTLIKLLQEKQQRESRDRTIVDDEFERIKKGLRAEIEKYHSQEYDRVKLQVQQYVRLLTEKEEHLERLKAQVRTLESTPPVCLQCEALRRALDTTPNEDKQRIRVLENEVSQQAHIIEHFKIAEMHRRIGTTPDMNEMSSETKIVALRQELDVAYRKLKDLQRLVVTNPYPTEDMRLQAEIITSASSRSPHHFTPGNNNDKGELDRVKVLLLEKEKEVDHLQRVIRDSHIRQLDEINGLRQQFQRYDDQIVAYLERVFSGQASVPNAHGNLTALQLAQAAGRAAKNAATVPPAFTSSPSLPPAFTSSTSPARHLPIQEASVMTSTTTPFHTFSNGISGELHRPVYQPVSPIRSMW